MSRFQSRLPMVLRRPAAWLAGVLLFASVGFAQQPRAQTPYNPPPAIGRPAQPAPPPASANVLDQPLRMVADAAQVFQQVRDYSCLFIKREVIQGRLQPENLISMRVRNQPFSVYLRWVGPKQFVGQEACYVAGRNGGMMRAHSPGLLGAVGWVSIDPRDPRAMQNNRHPITEAGIGNLIERLRQGWEWERQVNRTQVRVADYEFNKRRCTRVELIRPERIRGFYSYRTVVYFDQETRLPVRIENYDWPVSGGPPEGALQEMYSYVDLRFNAGLGDDAFRY